MSITATPLWPATSAPSTSSWSRSAARCSCTATACWARPQTPRTPSRRRSCAPGAGRDALPGPLVRADLALPHRDERLPGRARPPPARARGRCCRCPTSAPSRAAPPTADPAARYALHEGVELAFLTAIQQLPGRQRAVLILRDVLGWSPAEVGRAAARPPSPASTARCSGPGRRWSGRASPRTRRRRTRPTQRRLLRRYVDAWERADVPALVALLREDAELRMPPQASSGGPRSRASCRAQPARAPVAAGRPADGGACRTASCCSGRVHRGLDTCSVRRRPPRGLTSRAADRQADRDQRAGREPPAVRRVPAEPAVEVVAPLVGPCGSIVARWSLSGTWCTIVSPIGSRGRPRSRRDPAPAGSSPSTAQTPGRGTPGS